ncbi:MAG: hypothetical protein HQ548_05180 [Chloroflexi bacterium]|nr:hypothetical protein [Chloroflexota bacterium]
MKAWFSPFEKRAPTETLAPLACRVATSRYDAGNVARALRANHDLFRLVARAVSERLGYRYPEAADAEVARLMGKVLAGSG